MVRVISREVNNRKWICFSRCEINLAAGADAGADTWIPHSLHWPTRFESAQLTWTWDSGNLSKRDPDYKTGRLGLIEGRTPLLLALSRGNIFRYNKEGCWIFSVSHIFMQTSARHSESNFIISGIKIEF